MKNIIIFGAGRKGAETIKFFLNSVNVSIVSICDNDEKKWGKEISGILIESPSEVLTKKVYDAVIIAIEDYNVVFDDCKRLSKTKVYKSINEFISEVAYIDITNGCNAKCLYCITGKTNRNTKKKYEFMSFEKFKSIYQHLINKDIITNETELGLFNWGEPFLNPECIDIFDFLSKQKQQFVLSTNAAIYKEAKNEDTYLYCKRIYFSMPGFSQNSYDRIHGFNVNTIKDNIKKIYNNMLEKGFSGEGIISAHVYKFSKPELDELQKWAEALGLIVNPYYPYLNGNSLFVKYYKNELDKEYLSDISSDLHFEKWETVRKNRPLNYKCPISDWLVLDVKGEMVLCCQADEYSSSYYGWGEVFDLDSYEAYRVKKEKMLMSKSCAECKQYGIDYIVSCNIEVPID